MENLMKDLDVKFKSQDSRFKEIQSLDDLDSLFITAKMEQKPLQKLEKLSAAVDWGFGKHIEYLGHVLNSRGILIQSQSK